MSKFTKSINSTNTTLGERGELIASMAKRAQEDLIRDLEGKIDTHRSNIIQMCDIAPENSTSLKPQGKVVDDPKGWVNDLHQAKKSIALLEVELKIAKETLTEWFGEETKAAQ